MEPRGERTAQHQEAREAAEHRRAQHYPLWAWLDTGDHQQRVQVYGLCSLVFLFSKFSSLFILHTDLPKP